MIINSIIKIILLIAMLIMAIASVGAKTEEISNRCSAMALMFAVAELILTAFGYVYGR